MVGVRLEIEDGEILARTAKAMSGYWRKPSLSEEAFRGQWVRTGDEGEFEDGVLRILDRKKDVIISGGENVSSVQVEGVLHDHPDIVEVAVIGVPHERWGETPKALVVLREGASLDEAGLIAFCRERLAGFKCPKLDRGVRVAAPYSYRQGAEVPTPREVLAKRVDLWRPELMPLGGRAGGSW